MYYYNDGANDVGPFSIERLRSLRQSGLIGPGTLIRENCDSEWRPLSEIDRILEEQTITDEPNPLIDTGAQRARENARSTGRVALVDASGWLLEPETPWRRYAARMLDTSVNGVIAIFLFGAIFYALAPNTADNFFSLFEGGPGRIVDLVLTAIFASFVGGMLIGSTGLVKS